MLLSSLSQADGQQYHCEFGLLFGGFTSGNHVAEFIVHCLIDCQDPG
jgi:hypothetical protein